MKGKEIKDYEDIRATAVAIKRKIMDFRHSFNKDLTREIIDYLKE